MDLKISRSLELLHRLQQTTSEYAKREDQLTRDMLARRYALNRKHQEIITQIDSALTAQTDEMSARFHAESERIHMTCDNRRIKVQRAQTVGVGNLTKRTNEERAKWLGGLQMKRFRLERKQTAELESVDAAANEFTGKLSELHSGLAVIEKRTQKSFAGFASFLPLLRQSSVALSANDNHHHLLEKFQTKIGEAEDFLGSFNRLLWPRVFRAVPLSALAVIILVVGGALAFALRIGSPASVTVGMVLLVLLAVLFGIYFLGQHQSKPAAMAVAATLAEARQLHASCEATSQTSHRLHRRRIHEEYEHFFSDIQQQRDKVGNMEAEFKKNAREKIENQAPRVITKIEEVMRRKIGILIADRDKLLQRWNGEADARRKAATETNDAEVEALTAEENARWSELETGWKQEIIPLTQDIQSMN
ncbi:MAG: hypothetical protein WCN98_03850, partial [Verrucomicrobiaceae bacterium]